MSLKLLFGVGLLLTAAILLHSNVEPAKVEWVELSATVDRWLPAGAFANACGVRFDDFQHALSDFRRETSRQPTLSRVSASNGFAISGLEPGMCWLKPRLSFGEDAVVDDALKFGF